MNAGNHTPVWLWLVGAVFVAAIAAIVVTSVRRPEPPVFALSRLDPHVVPTGLFGPDTVTLDARSGDFWVLFDLERGGLTMDSAKWDIGVKRHRLVINGGIGFSGRGGVRLVNGPFERVDEAASDGYRPSRVTPGGDTVNAVLDDWYAYSFLSHLLEPKKNSTYLLRTAEGNYARFRVLSYYCPGPEPGCLTLEYVLNGDGTKALERAE